MTTGKTCPPWQRAVIVNSAVVAAALIIVLLYWARSILIPIAMAVFFSYILAPVVKSLQRRGLGQSVSVILTVSLATISFLAISLIITRQISSLTKTLADNAETVKVKIASAREAIVGNGDPRFQQMIDDLERTIVGDVQAAEQPTTQPPLVLESAKPKWMASLDKVIGPLTEAFGMAAFSFVLVVFILLAREDLRDRMLRLMGDHNLPSTTRAIDEATGRLSRYLLAQFVLNMTFGAAIGLLFWVFGVQYAVLWGFVAAIFRYVPYIGTWIGIIPPALFTLATTEGWWLSLLVIGIYGGLELFCNNFVEPKLYGSKLGVSEVAQLVAAAFWSFLWGPIGLILSGPISTCLVVLGRHSPRFHFFEVLLGTEPPLPPNVALFQRFMMHDADEAVRLIEKNTPQDKPVAVLDEVVIPALVQMKTSMHSGELGPDEIAPMLDTANDAVRLSLDSIDRADPIDPDPAGRGRLLLIPAKDEADQLALEILRRMLPVGQWDVQTVTVDTLVAEFIEKVNESQVDAVCIGSLPPTGLAQIRYLCKRLRQRNKHVRILIGRWGDTTNPDTFAPIAEVGANAIEVSIEKSLSLLSTWRPLQPEAVEPDKLPPTALPVGTSAAPVPAVAT